MKRNLEILIKGNLIHAIEVFKREVECCCESIKFVEKKIDAKYSPILNNNCLKISQKYSEDRENGLL
jgi:hypothetical protein